MDHTQIAIASGFGLLIMVAAIPAQAQANRTFVSGHGSDGNPCTLLAPCRSLAQAITQTNAGGEIAILDTAGYGALTITKSISIVNPEGVEGGISAAGAARRLRSTPAPTMSSICAG